MALFKQNSSPTRRRPKDESAFSAHDLPDSPERSSGPPSVVEKQPDLSRSFRSTGSDSMRSTSSSTFHTSVLSRSIRSELNFVCGPLYVKIGAVWALFDATINRKYFTLVLRSNTDALSSSPTGRVPIPQNSVIKIPISAVDTIKTLHYFEYYDNYVLDIHVEGKIVYPVVRETEELPPMTKKGKKVRSMTIVSNPAKPAKKEKHSVLTVKCFNADEMFDWLDAFEDIADSMASPPPPPVEAPASVTAPSTRHHSLGSVDFDAEYQPELKSPVLSPRTPKVLNSPPSNLSTLPTVVHECKKGAPVRRPVFGQHYYALA